VSGARAAFIDRDGVINELVPDPVSGLPESPLRIEDVALIPGAAAALRELRAAGWLLIGVSNQPAAAKGKVTVPQLEAVQARVMELLAQHDVSFDDFRLCLHHPQGVVPDLARECDCRKPAPGLLLDAGQALDVDFSHSWMIGDTDADVVAGHAAGCKTVLVQHGASAHKREGNAGAAYVAQGLEAAVQVVMEAERGGERCSMS
jgi:D-glycero-D-manno-heptose 1,7-bisphosphate phosphatase